jgi:hypothetical protein
MPCTISLSDGSFGFYYFKKVLCPVLQNAPGVYMYFIFDTHQLSCIMAKCSFIISEEAML